MLPIDNVVESEDSVVGVVGVDSDCEPQLLSVDSDKLLHELAVDRDMVE